MTSSLNLFDQAKDNGISPHAAPRKHRALAVCIQTSGHFMTIAEEVAAGRLMLQLTLPCARPAGDCRRASTARRCIFAAFAPMLPAPPKVWWR